MQSHISPTLHLVVRGVGVWFDLRCSCSFVAFLCTNDFVCNLVAAVFLCQHVPRQPHTASTQAEGSGLREREVQGAFFPLPCTRVPLLQQDLQLFRALDRNHRPTILSMMNPLPVHICMHVWIVSKLAFMKP